MSKDKKHAFDLHSQKGVADLLAQVRSSALPASTKTTIREMVLKYAQRGGDAGVREELESMLESLVIVPGETVPEASAEESEAKEAEKTPEKKESNFAGSRPVPSFAPVSVQKKREEEAKKEQSVSETTEVSEEKSHQDPAPETVVEEVAPVPEVAAQSPEPAPVAKEEVVPEVQESVPAIPKEEPAATPEIKEEKTTVAPAPQPEPMPAPAPAPAVAPVVTGDNLGRIQEIKKEVIALVGNPVNLVNANNEVGKEYMGALLDAMKKNNAGTKAQAAEAMARLEAAFVAVQQVAAEPRASESAPDEAASQPESVEPVSEIVDPVPEPEPSAEEVSENKSDSEAEIEKQEESSVVDEVTSEEKAETAEDEVPASSLGGAPLKDIPSHGFSKPPEPATRPEVVPSMPEVPEPPSIGEPLPAEDEKEELPAENVSEEELTQPQPPEPVSKFGSETPEPPAAVVPENTQESAEKPAAAPVAGVDASLMSLEITSGLQQLLSEWKIFKSSGLFGMGPSGMDHPLYISIKDSSMLTVDKGNFKGSNEEIQQSLQDYLNGWRHEQGIVYQHTETFEHFLRRVVKRILDKTK